MVTAPPQDSDRPSSHIRWLLRGHLESPTQPTPYLNNGKEGVSVASLDDFVAIALTQRGDPYIFGAEASFSDPDPKAFDCSELVEWSAARCGVTFVDGAQNQRDACRHAGTLVNVDTAKQTRGALLFRIDEGPGNDHVAISLGDGKTFEARGKAYGVNVFDAGGRKWTHGGFVPGLVQQRAGEPADQLLRQGSRGEDVRWVQRRLHMHGFDPGPADGVFGPRTDRAVRAFQQSHGLEVDGVVGPKTRPALADPPA
jgi:cell wall-associated NlpC family hydrolase